MGAAGAAGAAGDEFGGIWGIRGAVIRRLVYSVTIDMCRKSKQSQKKREEEGRRERLKTLYRLKYIINSRSIYINRT
jgi:hypothetical protein